MLVELDEVVKWLSLHAAGYMYEEKNEEGSPMKYYTDGLTNDLEAYLDGKQFPYPTGFLEEDKK